MVFRAQDFQLLHCNVYVNTAIKLGDVTALKCTLKQNFSDIWGDVEEDEIETGFIDPGHGAKGKRHWIVEDDDLQDMYKHTNM